MSPGCAQVEPELSAYLDGELDAAARARIEAHLHGCAHCAAEVRELRRVGESLRRWDAEETRYATSTGFRNRVLARLGAGDAAPADEARTWGRAAFVAAAAASVVGAFAWASNRPAATPGVSLDDIAARVAAAEHGMLDAARGPAAAGGAAREAPERIGVIPPVVGRPSPPAPVPARAEGPDPWEARGDGMLLRDVVAEYERFVIERRNLSMEERVARVERREAAGPSATTSAAPPPPPLAAYLAQASVSPTRFPPFERVQVWPVEMSVGANADRPLLLERAIDERAVSIAEDENGNVVAENSDLKGRTVLLVAGDVLRGGRCDRVLRESMLLAPGRRITLPVLGASEVRPRTSYRSFTRSRLAAPADLRALLATSSFGAAVSQRDVDQMVRTSISDLGSLGGDGSLENLWTNSELQGEVQRYADAFRKRLDRPHVVGFAFAAGPDLVGIEICGDPATFRDLRDRLLRSHLLWALARPGADVQGPPPSDTAVAAVLAAAGRAVFDEPVASGDGALGIFRSVDGAVFGSGLLDGTKMVHATVFAGMPATGASGPARRGAAGLGRGPGRSPADRREPVPAPEPGGGGVQPPPIDTR